MFKGNQSLVAIAFQFLLHGGIFLVMKTPTRLKIIILILGKNVCYRALDVIMRELITWRILGLSWRQLYEKQELWALISLTISV